MINLTHEEAQQVLDALAYHYKGRPEDHEVIYNLRAKLSEPEIQLGITYEEANQPEPVAWIPVADAMPVSGLIVLACYKNSLGKLRRIRAHWIAAKTEEASGECEFGEYDEEADTYWNPEGWYECIDNWDEYSSVAVHEGEITHWMLMPDYPYTAPPQREWVGLTDEEITELWEAPGDSGSEFARAIEAKIKEKNYDKR